MGDDLKIDMSGMKIFFGGRELKELKEVHEIHAPPDMEIGDLTKGHLQALPPMEKTFEGDIDFSAMRRPRWRQPLCND